LLGDEKHTSTDDVIQAQQQARSQALKRKLVVAAVLLVVVALAFIFFGVKPNSNNLAYKKSAAYLYSLTQSLFKQQTYFKIHKTVP